MKALNLGEFAEDISQYLSMADIVSAKVLAEISTSIAKKRLEMCMTQKEFAKFMDVSQGMVSRWEGENYNFSVEALAQICEKLHLELHVEMEDTTSSYRTILKKRNGSFTESPEWNNKKQIGTIASSITPVAV